MKTTNDQFYIEKVLKGDANAFAFLVDSYKKMIFTLAFKMTKNREEAEEICQDAFIKAYQNLNKFQGDSKFSTWLYSIAYNASLDAIKKNKKHNNTLEINEINYHKIASFDTALQQIEQKERAKIMDNCLLKLPEDEGSIIWMFYYDELSLKEICEITLLSESNLKVKLHRARKRLLNIVETTVEPEIISHYGKS